MSKAHIPSAKNTKIQKSGINLQSGLNVDYSLPEEMTFFWG